MNSTSTDWIIKEIRIRGWSYRELGRRSGLSHTYIANTLTGKRNITFDFCAAIAKALKIPAIEAFYKTGLLTNSKSNQDEGLLLSYYRDLNDNNKKQLLVIAEALQKDQ